MITEYEGSTGVYDWPAQVYTDTLKGKQFVLQYDDGNGIKSLLGANVIFEVFRSAKSKIYLQRTSEAGQITILDAPGCIISINDIPDHGLSDYRYLYRIRVEYADGFKHTFLNGYFPVLTSNESAKGRIV